MKFVVYKKVNIVNIGLNATGAAAAAVASAAVVGVPPAPKCKCLRTVRVRLQDLPSSLLVHNNFARLGLLELRGTPHPVGTVYSMLR